MVVPSTRPTKLEWLFTPQTKVDAEVEAEVLVAMDAVDEEVEAQAGPREEGATEESNHRVSLVDSPVKTRQT
eukprot:10221830-Ditylum_brightwellii.AAC.1